MWKEATCYLPIVHRYLNQARLVFINVQSQVITVHPNGVIAHLFLPRQPLHLPRLLFLEIVHDRDTVYDFEPPSPIYTPNITHLGIGGCGCGDALLVQFSEGSFTESKPESRVFVRDPHLGYSFKNNTLVCGATIFFWDADCHSLYYETIGPRTIELHVSVNCEWGDNAVMNVSFHAPMLKQFRLLGILPNIAVRECPGLKAGLLNTIIGNPNNVRLVSIENADLSQYDGLVDVKVFGPLT